MFNFRWRRPKPSLATTAALHRAIDGANAEAVAALLASGADPNAKNEDGHTSLHRAAWRGYAEVVDVLHAAGADLDAQNRLGYTALHSAAEGGHHETIHRLLDAGAKPNLLAQHDQTPLDRWKGEKSDAFWWLDSAINGHVDDTVPTQGANRS